MISIKDIRMDKVKGIVKRIMAAKTAALRSNQPYQRFNNIKALVH